MATGGFPEAVVVRGGPSALRPPAFPGLLAATYELTGHVNKPPPFRQYFAPGYVPQARQVNAGRIVQALVGTLTVMLTGLVGYLLWGRRIGLWALAISALYLPLILLGFTLYSEPLFIACEMAALACLLRLRSSDSVRKRWAIAAGVMVGFAWLTRSNDFVLVLPMVLLSWTDRPRFSRRALVLPALAVLATLVTVAPWTIRNANVMHAFVPVSDNSGYILAGTYNETARTDPHFRGWRPAQEDPADNRLIISSAGSTSHGVLEAPPVVRSVLIRRMFSR